MERKTLTLKGLVDKPVKAPAGNQFDADFALLLPLVGKQVVIQQKRGVIYKGTLMAFTRPWLCLKDALIVGKRADAKVDEVFLRVDAKMVEHVHEDGAVVTPREVV